jgi:hypothetical protein
LSNGATMPSLTKHGISRPLDSRWHNYFTILDWRLPTAPKQSNWILLLHGPHFSLVTWIYQNGRCLPPVEWHLSHCGKLPNRTVPLQLQLLWSLRLITPIPHAHHFLLAPFLVPELGNLLPWTSCWNISLVKGTWPLSTCLPTGTSRPSTRWSTFANATLASTAQQASTSLNWTIVSSWEVLRLLPPQSASCIDALASRVHGLSKLVTQRFLPSRMPRWHSPKHMTLGYHPSLCCFSILRFAKTHHIMVSLLSPPHLSLSTSTIK